MNVNVKMDGEDDQSTHLQNRTAMALQSAPAAYINLNIVNPNLNNSGYILNPVNSVPQNIVAYQSPVTLQSYITLQEADGNLVNNLQVGVPVPIGLPVPAELLQNPNLVNTSIIIGNEECNQSVIFKPAPNNPPEPNGIKISYLPKPLMHEVKAVVSDEQALRMNDITAVNMDSLLKKPCPLEMSIKAANIDLEFDKCDPEDLNQENSELLQTANYPIIQKLPLPDQLTENVVLDVPIVQEGPEETKKGKTQITWENNSIQHQAANEFQESLICEVEEANEDEDERSLENNACNSSDEIETLPLSVVLKLRRIQEEDDDEKSSKKKIRDFSNKSTQKESDEFESKKFLKVRYCCSKRECFKKITLKDQKTVHKNFYDLESTAKQDVYLNNCIEHVQSNRFYGESAKERNDIKEKSIENDDKNILEATNIQLEIENESNGNKMLSDEIQKAIKESLKDCMVNQSNKDDISSESEKRLMEVGVKDNSDCEDDGKMCQPLSEESSPISNNDETFDVWDFARIHLNTLSCEENPGCRSNPRHRFLTNGMSLERLFEVFKDFYQERAGKELKVKLNSYRRFLRTDGHVSLSRSKQGGCIECDQMEDDDEEEQEQERKKVKKGIKSSTTQNNLARLDRNFQTRKIGRRKWEISSDSEVSSDDEPLMKRKNLKLTISLKDNKVQNSDSIDDSKKPQRKAKKETKPKGNGVRGRDVWSLMLLHLETMPYKICKNCVSRKRHRFFDASMTKQALYEDYRRYFLKETNSELGLGFAMYEKYFDRNCGYAIGDIDVNSPVCPKCAMEPSKQDKSQKKSSKHYNNNIRLSRYDDVS